MSEDTISKARIFEQIVELQKSLSSLKEPLFNVQCVADRQYCEREENEDEPILCEFSPEVALEKLAVIRELAVTREQTLARLLDFYMALYNETEHETPQG